MATKIAIKNQTLTSFGGIYYIEDEYTRLFAELIDHSLGLRSKLSGYQYSEILRSLTMVYFCGGDHLEDITKLGHDLRLRPDSRIPSSDTIARGLKELSEQNLVYTSKSGKDYAYNACGKLNCQSRQSEFDACDNWKDVEINYEKIQVASFPFKEFMEDSNFRLVVQRTKVKPKEGENDLFGKRYVYRAILTFRFCHRSGQMDKDRKTLDPESLHEETLQLVC